MDPNGTDMEP